MCNYINCEEALGETARGHARAVRKRRRESYPSWLRRLHARSHARSLATRNEIAYRINFNNLNQELLLGNHVTEVTLTLS